MAGQSHGNFSGKEIAADLARYAVTGRNEGNRRPLGSRASFGSASFTECDQSRRRKFPVKSRAPGFSTHPHSPADRFRVRSTPPQPLINVPSEPAATAFALNRRSKI